MTTKAIVARGEVLVPLKYAQVLFLFNALQALARKAKKKPVLEPSLPGKICFYWTRMQ